MCGMSRAWFEPSVTAAVVETLYGNISYHIMACYYIFSTVSLQDLAYPEFVVLYERRFDR